MNTFIETGAVNTVKLFLKDGHINPAEGSIEYKPDHIETSDGRMYKVANGFSYASVDNSTIYIQYNLQISDSHNPSAYYVKPASERINIKYVDSLEHVLPLIASNITNPKNLKVYYGENSGQMQFNVISDHFLYQTSPTAAILVEKLKN